MKRDEQFKFKTSISREGYENKDTAKMCLSSITSKKIGKAKMAFKETEVTVTEFLNYAVNGYAFCNLFRFDENKKYWIKKGVHNTLTYPVYKNGVNKGYFKLTFKADDYFYGSQTIFVDIDYTHFQEISDYINCLRYKPTCVYTSYSDKADKHGIVSRRFRLVYVFDTILDANEFRDITFTLYDSIVEDTKEPMYDSCGCSYSQYMNGSNSNECYVSNIIYTASDFPKYEIPQVEQESPSKASKTAFTEELLNDIEYMPYEIVVRKWWSKGLRYITQSELEFNGFYTTTSEDFIQLAYLYNKVEDGNHRRKKLYIRAALRRLIKEDITADELLYNLYIDRYKFFDNSDGVITLEVLQNKVKAAMRTDINTIKEMAKETYKPSFIINPEVEDKHLAVAKARTAITDAKIGEMYDVSLSVKENHDILCGYGVNVSLSRLYKWCDDNHIEKVKKSAVEGYNPNLSIRENMKVMGCTMYQVQKAKELYNTTHYLYS